MSQDPASVGYGWRIVDCKKSKLMSQDAAPVVCTEFIHCSCVSSKCQRRRCSCYNHNLHVSKMMRTASILSSICNSIWFLLQDTNRKTRIMLISFNIMNHYLLHMILRILHVSFSTRTAHLFKLLYMMVMGLCRNIF